MLTHEKLSSLIGKIYGAAADASLWPQFLEEFADAIGGTASGIVYYDLRLPGSNSGVFGRTDPEQSRKYLEHFANINPWMKAWETRQYPDGPMSITISDQLIELSRLKKTEFYHDFLRLYDQAHQFSGMISKTQDWGAEYFCVRSRRKGPFGPAEVKALRTIFPHLQQAMQLRRRMAELEGENRALLDALDRLPVGVILLDDHCRVLRVNRSAESILAQNDGLFIGKRGIEASAQQQCRVLRSALTAAALTSAGKGFSSGGHLGIPRPSGKRPFVVHVMSASVRSLACGGNFAAVIVLVTDPERGSPRLADLMQTLYGLTPAESRLADHLVAGRSLSEAAEMNKVTRETVRSQIKSIFSKTGVRRQAELIRLLSALPNGKW